MKVKIACAQMEVKPWDLMANYAKIQEIFAHAGKNKCNFLCLPEDCWVGPSYREKNLNEVARFAKDKLARLTKKYGLYCIGGTVYEHHHHKNGSAHYHNFAYVFGPDGKKVGRYPKRHLVPGSEGKLLNPGHTHRVFDTEFGKIGIQICRDILYPETTQVTADLGARIIFSPAFWWKLTNQYPSTVAEYHAYDELQMIKYLVPARALENSVIFMFCNAAGEYNYDKRQDTLLGYTQVCEPFMGIKKILRHNREGLLITTVDTDIVDEARKGWKIRQH